MNLISHWHYLQTGNNRIQSFYTQTTIVCWIKSAVMIETKILFKAIHLISSSHCIALFKSPSTLFLIVPFFDISKTEDLLERVSYAFAFIYFGWHSMTLSLFKWHATNELRTFFSSLHFVFHPVPFYFSFCFSYSSAHSHIQALHIAHSIECVRHQFSRVSVDLSKYAWKLFPMEKKAARVASCCTEKMRSTLMCISLITAKTLWQLKLSEWKSERSRVPAMLNG